MTRVSRATSHRGALVAAPFDRPRATARKKKPYKIVLEAVTQEKRKLKSTLTYHDQAPSGFGYIPVGHPEITEWCKEQCRQRNLDVHIVSAKPRSKAFLDPDKISSHVHRIGHHFPLEIIELACRKFGYRYSEARGLRRLHTRGSPVSGPAYVERGIADYEQRQGLHGKPVTDTEHKEHIRGAIREIFPKIPDADLTSIVNHAFKEGTNRVGNAKELSLARRVQLAVVAHIRHTYTEYDNILKHKTGTWNEARQRVEHVSLAKLKEWRDETDEESKELEETFREIIVLDDDDEEDSSDNESSSAPNTREPSLEIVSSRATARDLQPEQIDRVHVYDPYVSRGSRRTIILRPAPIQSPRQSLRQPHVPSPSYAQFHPQASRAEVRALPAGPIVNEPRAVQAEAFRVAYGESYQQSQVHSGHMLTVIDGLDRPMNLIPREPVRRVAHPMQCRDSAGRLYTLEPIDADRDESSWIPSRRHADSDRVDSRSHYLNPVPHGYSPSIARPNIEPSPYQVPSPQHSRPRLTPSSRRASDQDVVLPSVEREPEPPVQKRKSIPAPVYEDYPTAAYEDYSGPSTKRVRSAVDMPIRYEASNPAPVYSNGKGVYAVVDSRAEAPDYSYNPVVFRKSPVRERRAVYREGVVQETPRAYEGIRDRRAVPTMERDRLSGPAPLYETRDGPYLSRGANGAGGGYYVTR